MTYKPLSNNLTIKQSGINGLGLFATKRIEALTQLIGDIKFKHLDIRIMEWLNKQPESMVDITHEALATELGSTRVTVSRILKKLESEGKVLLHRKKIEVI